MLMAKERRDNLNKREYCIITEYWHQYTWGLTGQTNVNTIHLKNDDLGFATREEAQQAANNKGYKNYKVKGAKNEGYGSVGAKSNKVEIRTIAHVLRNEDKYRYYSVDVI